MTSLADQLPLEIAQQVHPDWRKNEAGYWTVRDHLLRQNQNQWIGFADGAVVTSGISPVQVFHAAQQTGRHPFVICVGRENEPSLIRRASFQYDNSYSGEALPVLTVEFREKSGSAGVVLDRVIPDTGADASVLPWADCQLLELRPTEGVPGLISGVADGTTASIAFLIWAWLDGKEYPCRVQADFAGSERIMGRDVLNRLEILFRGPTGEVIISP